MFLSAMHCACAYFITPHLNRPILWYPLCSFIFGFATSPLPTLHCSPVSSFCMLLSLWVWACYYRNHTEGQSRGEEGEMLTSSGGWEQADDAAPSDWLQESFNPAHPRCVMIIIISAAKLVTAAAAGSLSLSVSLCLLSHCQRCSGPCVELELWMSWPFWTGEDCGCNVISGRPVDHTARGTGDNLTGSFKWTETSEAGIWLVYWSFGVTDANWWTVKKEDKNRGTAQIDEDGRFQLTLNPLTINDGEGDNTNNVFLFCWQLKMPATVQWDDGQKWHHNRYGA